MLDAWSLGFSKFWQFPAVDIVGGATVNGSVPCCCFALLLFCLAVALPWLVPETLASVLEHHQHHNLRTPRIGGIVRHFCLFKIENPITIQIGN